MLPTQIMTPSRFHHLIDHHILCLLWIVFYIASAFDKVQLPSTAHVNSFFPRVQHWWSSMLAESVHFLVDDIVALPHFRSHKTARPWTIHDSSHCFANELQVFVSFHRPLVYVLSIFASCFAPSSLSEFVPAKRGETPHAISTECSSCLRLTKKNPLASAAQAIHCQVRCVDCMVL